MGEVIRGAKKKVLAMEAVDELGNIADFDGMARWNMTNADQGLLEIQGEKGLTALLSLNGLKGAGKIQCVIDADMTEGQRDVVGEWEYEVVAGEAVLVKLTASDYIEPTPEPEPVPEEPVEEPAPEPVPEEPVVSSKRK